MQNISLTLKHNFILKWWCMCIVQNIYCKLMPIPFNCSNESTIIFLDCIYSLPYIVLYGACLDVCITTIRDS